MSSHVNCHKYETKAKLSMFSFCLFTHVRDSKNDILESIDVRSDYDTKEMSCFRLTKLLTVFLRQGDKIRSTRALNICHSRISFLSMMSTNFCIRTQFVNFLVKASVKSCSDLRDAHHKKIGLISSCSLPPSVRSPHRYHWFCTWL